MAGVVGLGCGFALVASAQSWDPSCDDGTKSCISIVAPRDLTPAEQAEQDRRNRAAAAAAAARKASVDALVGQWGEHRRGEAERYVEMQMAAEAARPKPATSQPGYPPRTCSTSRTQEARTGVFPFMSGNKQDYRSEGRAEMLRSVQVACTGGEMKDFNCTGGGAIGFFSCKVAYTCPVTKTTCSGGPPAPKVSPQ